MSVYRVIDVIGTSSESWRSAAATAIKTASQSVRDLARTQHDQNNFMPSRSHALGECDDLAFRAADAERGEHVSDAHGSGPYREMKGEDTGSGSDQAVCALTLGSKTAPDSAYLRQRGRDQESGSAARRTNRCRAKRRRNLGFGKDMREVDAVVRHAEIGHGHVDEEHERGEARCNSERKKDASAELNKRHYEGRHVRSGKTQAGKELRHLVEVRQFAPAVLGELKTPVKSNGEKQRTLQAG